MTSGQYLFVDEHALAVLEYPAIVERLAAAAATEHGRELALALLPSPDASEVERRQALTAEALALFEESLEPALAGLSDIRAPAAHAELGGTLTPHALAAIGRSVRIGVRAAAAVEEHRELAPLLADVCAPIDRGLDTLADAIERAVEEDGSDLRDTASPRLRKLRGELRTGKGRVAEELRRLARGSELSEHLQEDFVTERGGRPVLAVRASARGKVQGIVHDSSSSGQTLFVEPFAIVELNNRLSETASAEREEVERILRELSGQVGDVVRELVALVEATARLDLALVSAAVSRGWRGAPVTVADEVALLGVRHPLLPSGAAVPIDLDLGGLRALVISGPNTGGKTVALKTLGLAALVHQAGLRPPADRATLPVFDQVLADIGDEQSIERSLSTFSGHLSNLVTILASATARSLVLVDELASGTDPVEGAALAQALLARLAGQARLTAVTTHYPELKEWASAVDGVANAATGFDPDTHEPLYQVALGRPGTSHALRIAARLGLDDGLVADARGRVAPERLRIEDLLAEAEGAERAAAGEREVAAAERRDAEEAVRRVESRERELGKEIERVRATAAAARAEAVRDAERDLAAARAELASLRDEIRAARRRESERRRSAARAASRPERERDRLLGRASERAALAEQALKAVDEPPPPAGPLAAGDPVVAPDLGVRGTIAAIDGDEAEVVGPGGLKVRIALERLRADTRPAASGEPAPPPVKVVAAARGDVSDELDVRGRTAQEAREAVRTFVDEAALAGLPLVRVVHGRGTGALRTAVREELRRHELVDRHEADSADGATVAHLAGR